MNPILRYIKQLASRKRVLGDDAHLSDLVQADSLLQELVDDKKVPGISIVVYKDGKALLRKGYGYADVENRIRMDPQKTICRIASISKNIAAIALAHMVQEGIISLDASLYEYVPYFPRKKWDFTIRQLASHTAGMRGYRGMEYGLDRPYTIRESIAVFKDDDLLFEPGTDYAYTSFDWVLISLAMQEASGVPFETYVQEKVLTPLNMTNTLAPLSAGSDAPQKVELTGSARTSWPSGTVSGTVATFYTTKRGGFRKAASVNNYYKLAGGGYLSTAHDIANFGQAVLNKVGLNESLLEQFLTSETVGRRRTYYGLGWQVSEDGQGRSYYGHVGNGVGGYSNLFIYPKERMVFVALVNCTNPGVQEQLNRVQDRLLEMRGK